jgi:hypothetical protein
MNVEDGKAAARLVHYLQSVQSLHFCWLTFARTHRHVGLTILSSFRNTFGSLDRAVRVVKLLAMVNGTVDFEDHITVANGCSEVLIEVFGEANGVGARSAVGMGSLPGNIPFECEGIIEVLLD